jgi:hypothetical protein
MARLKKTVTKEKGVIGAAPTKKITRATTLPATTEEGQNEAEEEQAPPPMSLMEALQAKIRTRFLLLHPERDSDDD